MWRWRPSVVINLIAGLTIAAWVLTYVSGGSRSALPHAFYLPVVLAAYRFRWLGAATSAIVAGLAAGPFMPLDVSTGGTQSLQNWTARLIAFLIIGFLVAWLSDQSRASLAQALRDGRLASDLHGAIVAGDIALHYQPIVDLQTGHAVGFEALARWNRPKYGPVPPSEFIPAAERLGIVTTLDMYVLGEATREAAAWPTHPNEKDAAFVAVNLSAHSFGVSTLPDDVHAALAKAALPPERLHIELTETAVLADQDAAREAVRRLRAMGVRVSIDDFGTGQSSLSYLHSFPVDTIKIDRSFVADLEHSRATALAAGVVQIAAALDAHTIAEGVERPEQLRTLVGLGCSHAQGFLLDRPMPANKVPAAARRTYAMPTRREDLTSGATSIVA